MDTNREPVALESGAIVVHASTPADELLTPAQVAELLQVSTATLAAWRRIENRGPVSTRLGHRTVRYRRTAVEAFVASREQRADG